MVMEHKKEGFDMLKGAGTIRCLAPEILARKGYSARDIMYGARLNQTTAYQLADPDRVDEIKGLQFSTLVRICEFLEVQVGDLLVYEPPKK